MATWLEDRMDAGAEAFAAQGWPTRALEAWKTTPIKPLVSFGQAPLPAPSPATLTAAAEAVAAMGPSTGPRLVLVGGQCVDALSNPGGLDTSSAGAEEHLGAIASIDQAPLVALSAQGLDRAIVVRAPEGESPPIEIVHVGVPGGAHCRVLVVADTSREVTVIERFVDIGGDPSWINTVTEVSVGPNARVQHVQVLAGGPAATRTGNLTAQVDRDGHFHSHVVALGGRIGRSEVLVRLAGQGASCHLDGLYVASDESVLDNYTEIEHLAPHTSSDEVYRGVIGDKAVGGFVGRVLIHEGAIKSETHQLNNNLLLSPGAVVHTRPQLEIDNDDVAATHGSTVGQLEQDAIFYLRTRGLDETNARALMTWAFARTQIDRLPTEVLRAAVASAVAAQLNVDLAWVGELD